jgi:PKD repeat protein
MHLYSLPGLYTVNLTVTKGVLSNKTTKINYINVTKPVPVGPTANFTANTTCGVRDVTVAFTDSSSGSPDSWLWSFGDNATSTVQSPAHTYTSAGSYTVSLRVAKSGDGNDTRTMPGYVTVYNPVSMTASANVTSGQAPLTVRFDTVVTGGPGVWTFSWAFGDGTNSTEQSPVHVYQKQGSYPACVTGTTTVCGQTLVRSSCVDIAVGPSGPTGSLRVTSLPGNATVFIDGVGKGYTPVTITGIPAGSCHLKVSKSGYQSFDKTVNIKPDKTSTQMVFMRNTIGKVILKPLAPSKGSISVVTFPNSTVYLNNVEKGTSPLTIKDLAPGVYSVKVSLAGYPEHTIPVVRVMRGFTTPVNWYFVNSLPNATPTPGTPPGFGA